MAAISYTYPTQNARANAQGACNSSNVCSADELGEEKSGFGFKDILDSVNPLQQLPIISSLYRSATGDTISAASRMAGGALFGGPIGFIASAVNAGIDAVSGADIGGHVLNALESDSVSAAGKYAQAYQLK